MSQNPSEDINKCQISRKRKLLCNITKRHFNRLKNLEIKRFKKDINNKIENMTVISSNSPITEGVEINNKIENMTVISSNSPITEGVEINNKIENMTVISSNSHITEGVPQYFTKKQTLEKNKENTPEMLLTTKQHNSNSNINTEEKLEKELSSWFIKNNLSRESSNELLEILRFAGHENLPKDCRTLVKTPKKYSFKNCANGQYFYFGLEKEILFVLRAINFKIFSNFILYININIDGLPLCKSSGNQFWPILISVTNIKYNKPFVIALYFGKKKPINIYDFLNPFINEFNNISNNGIEYFGYTITVKIKNIICDAPAKAFILCVKSHTGYFGCNKCIEEGTYINKRISFINIDAALRTNMTFRQKLQPEYHKSTSPLQNLNIDLVDQIPLDYMHLICLGVMKRLLAFWVHGRAYLRLSEKNIKFANLMLLKMKKFTPTEFARQPRAITEFEYWKATEFRQFLLYTGPIVLKNILPKKYYIHFLVLHVAIRILCSPEYCLNYNNYAHLLLKYFVKKYKDLYGPEYITYNVHNLIHLAADVLRNGPLDCFSAFPFENYLYFLKKCVKQSRYPLQQAINKITKFKKHVINKSNSTTIYPDLDKNYEDYLPNKNNAIFYKKLIFENMEVTTSERNNCCLLRNGLVMIVKYIFKENNSSYIMGHIFTKTKPFYTIPCNSEKFNINIVYDLSITMQQVLAVDIKTILFKFPIKKDAYIGYCVVLFINFEEDKEYATVPIEWLTENDTKCYWTENKNITKLIKKKMRPEPDWQLYDCKVIKKYLSLEEALKKENKLVATSSQTDEEVLGRGQRKRKFVKLSDSDTDTALENVSDLSRSYNKAKYFKIKRPVGKKKWKKMITKFFDEYDEDDSISNISDSDNSACTPPPVLNEITPLTDITNTAVLNFDPIQSYNSGSPSTSATHLTTPLVNITNTDAANVLNIDSMQSCNPEKPSTSATYLITPLVGTANTAINSLNIDSCSSSGTSTSAIHFSDSPVLDAILENVLSLKLAVTRIEQKMNNGEGVQKQINIIQYDCIKSLPVQNIDELENLEKLISEEDEAQNQLIFLLQHVGGKNIKQLLHRMLATVFSNNCAQKCSLTGAKKNYRLKDLKLIALIKDCMKKTFNGMTEYEFEEILKGWFRHASQRVIRLSTTP